MVARATSTMTRREEYNVTTTRPRFEEQKIPWFLYIRFDKLRLRLGSTQGRFEQTDAALAYYLTLKDRADMHAFQLHPTTHEGDLEYSGRELAYIGAVADGMATKDA
jgi:hypothetical protein